MSFSSNNITGTANHNHNNNQQNHHNIARKATEPSSFGSAANNNDNFEFVSADVNEVLQGARLILTNQEQRRDVQHPNERVLDESTTVRVTKQGGDEDPMEVTVLRKRLVKRDEEPHEEVEAEDRGLYFCFNPKKT